ncbi:MAG: hypothetical protein ACLQM8_21025 [Limisphaerales bacterium]
MSESKQHAINRSENLGLLRNCQRRAGLMDMRIRPHAEGWQLERVNCPGATFVKHNLFAVLAYLKSVYVPRQIPEEGPEPKGKRNRERYKGIVRVGVFYPSLDAYRKGEGVLGVLDEFGFFGGVLDPELELFVEDVIWMEHEDLAQGDDAWLEDRIEGWLPLSEATIYIPDYDGHDRSLG